MPRSPTALQASADRIRWYHRMDLGSGVRTNGVYEPSLTLTRLGLPSRLDGMRVLDVGAWDGYFSFEMERRGADVLATDSYCWHGDGWGTKDGFLLARDALSSSVRDLDIDPTELSPDAVGGTYDVVLFLGVLYHLRDPMGVLDRLRSVTAGLLVVETEMAMLLSRRPAAAFFPAQEFNNDPTNWWAPNTAAAIGMLRAAGFSEVDVAWRRPWPARVARWTSRTYRPRLTLGQALSTDRYIFHARP